jgi:hypothetical protein
MQPRRLRHTIRHTEQICRGCWEVRTQTEDGHRFTAFGVTLRQAIYRVHQKAKAFVQDGSRTSHQPCAATVALSRAAMYGDVWSGESLPPDLRCAACGRAIAQPLPASSDHAAPPRGAWRHATATRSDHHQAPWWALPIAP